MRENGASGFSAPFVDQTYHESECVRVRRGFITFPASVILLAIIFLTAVVLKTHRGDSRSHDWKSSPLALLFRGLEQSAVEKRDRGRLTQMRDMDGDARKSRLRLSRMEDDGWVFTSCGGVGGKGGDEDYVGVDVYDGD